MYQRILAPVDGSPTSQRGFDEAITLAQRLGASLRVLNVVDARLLLAEMSAFAAPDQLLEDWRAAGDKIVGESVARAKEKGVAAEGAVVCDPGYRVCDLIVKDAADSHADLIVMGTHGRRGLRRLALGSDAEMVLRDSPVPVLLVRSEDRDEAPRQRGVRRWAQAVGTVAAQACGGLPRGEAVAVGAQPGHERSQGRSPPRERSRGVPLAMPGRLHAVPCPVHGAGARVSAVYRARVEAGIGQHMARTSWIVAPITASAAPGPVALAQARIRSAHDPFTHRFAPMQRIARAFSSPA